MQKLLFTGETCLNSIHGIAIANSTNLEFLKERFCIDIAIEINNINDHSKVSINKVISLFKRSILIIKKSISTKYDYFYIVFSLSTFGSLKTLVYILSFKLFNKGRIVLHIHRGDFLLSFYKNKINRFLTKTIFKLTDKVIVLSEIQKKEMSVFKNVSFEVLQNTVDVELIPKDDENNKTKYIYISNYLLDKGILNLLDAFVELKKQYPHIYIETYGSFADESLKAKILNYADSQIIINDVIQGIEKFNKIVSSDCLILPSWNEGQPIVLLEAMSLGVPIIATKVGLIPDMLGDSYPYLANPNETESLKKEIMKFINSDNVDLISKELKERYDKYYSREEHKKRLFEIFD
jgi:glycosyltransferase involved in cell wall biosynthesis